MKINKAMIIIFVTFLSLNLAYTEVRQCSAAGKYIIKFATIAPENSTWVKHMRSLDQRLNQKSQGRIGFRIYAGGIAGDELDVLKKIRIGQIHCAAFSGVGLAKILPMVRVLDLPFLFRTEKEIDSVKNDLTDFFAGEFRKSGFEFLAWADVGDVHLFSKKEIIKKDDISGLKIWTWHGDPISKKTFSIMGNNPISLAITDVTTALNTNMIDTVYGPPLGALALQWHSYTKYMTAFPIAHSTGSVLISEKYFKEMPKDLADLLIYEIRNEMLELSAELKKQTDEALEIIQNSGVKISPAPDENSMSDFYKVHGQVARELVGDLYPNDLLDRVYAILADLR